MQVTKFDSLWLEAAFVFNTTVAFKAGVDYTLRHDWDCSQFGVAVLAANSADHICKRGA